jgi:hypothetical protein
MTRLHIASLSWVALLLCADGAWSAPPIVITFEDLPGDLSAIPNGYNGFNWTNMYVLDGSQPVLANSGYDHGSVSGVNVAYNGFGDPGHAITISGDPFNFIGAYFTGAWNNGLSITVNGYNNGALQNTSTFTVSTLAPSYQALNYANIDELKFSSTGGVDGGFVGFGTHFAMDDFTFSPVPEPSTLVLCLSGLVGWWLSCVRQEKGSGRNGTVACRAGKWVRAEWH